MRKTERYKSYNIHRKLCKYTQCIFRSCSLLGSHKSGKSREKLSCACSKYKSCQKHHRSKIKFPIWSELFPHCKSIVSRKAVPCSCVNILL